MPLVALERGGVVHQHADGAERRYDAWQQGGGLRLIGEVGAQQHGTAADLADLRTGPLGGGNTGVVMDGNVETLSRERQRDGAADALRSPSDKSRARDVGRDYSHTVLR